MAGSTEMGSEPAGPPGEAAMRDDEWIAVKSELTEIVRDPSRGIRPSNVLVNVSPPELAVRAARPAAIRRILRSLVAAASWGGGVEALHVSASWQSPGAGSRGGLRLGAWSRREVDGHRAAGLDTIETALLADVRRRLEQAGGGALDVSHGAGQLACELIVESVEPAWEGTAERFLEAFGANLPAA